MEDRIQRGITLTMRLFAAAFAALSLTLLGGSGVASADVTNAVLDGSATLKRNGRALEMTGSLVCDAGERVMVTVNPMTGNTSAVGRTRFVCTGDVQTFSVTVRARGSMSFEKDLGTSGSPTFHLFAQAPSGVDSGPFDVSW